MEELRVNRRKLITKANIAEVMFCGDWHLGNPQSDTEKILEALKIAKQRKMNVLLMGDLFECGTRTSVGDSVFTQTLSPIEQLDTTIEYLKPLKHQIIGIHRGNHEFRVFRETGIDPSRIIADTLGVPYLGGAIWHLLRVGKVTYKMYSLHGRSAARFLWTKLKVAADVALAVAPAAHIVAVGHMHENMIVVRNFLEPTAPGCQRKQFIVLTGHYLRYDDSYAQEYGMSIGRPGSPRITLSAKRYDIHGSQ